jgi:predicted enzyme related to lactoylglutathione lyase
MSSFIWYDLMTMDMKASAEFYAHVVGWKIADSGMPGMDYAIIKAGDVEVGGMMPVPPTAKGMPPCWNGYIHSSDVDGDAKKAVSLGGSIFQEAMDIPGIGRFAVIADPSGAAFIVFKPNTSESPTKVPDGTLGHIGWRELMSSDWQRDWSFYSAMFGWSKADNLDMGPMGTYQMFHAGGAPIGGMMTKTPDDPMPPHWNYYFNVDSAEAAVARAKAKGATITFGPMEVPGGQWAVNGIDPQGAMFSLVSNAK